MIGGRGGRGGFEGQRRADKACVHACVRLCVLLCACWLLLPCCPALLSCLSSEGRSEDKQVAENRGRADGLITKAPKAGRQI